MSIHYYEKSAESFTSGRMGKALAKNDRSGAASVAMSVARQVLIDNSEEIREIDREIAEIRLSPKHKRFVDRVLKGEGPYDACIAVGYSQRSAYCQASRLTNRADIKRVLTLHHARDSLINGIPVSWKRTKLVEIAQTASEPGDNYQPGSAVRAVSELAKLDGDYPDAAPGGVNVNVNLSFDFDLTGISDTESPDNVVQGQVIDVDQDET